VRDVYGIEILKDLPVAGGYDAVILAVPHDELIEIGAQGLRAMLDPNGVLFDMKAVFDQTESDLRL